MLKKNNKIGFSGATRQTPAASRRDALGDQSARDARGARRVTFGSHARRRLPGSDRLAAAALDPAPVHLRIADEDRYIDAATLLVQINATPRPYSDWHADPLRARVRTRGRGADGPPHTLRRSNR